MKRKMNIAKQIETARELLNKKELNFENDVAVKLKEITDRAELAYNDVKIKRLRSKAAEQMMNELTVELQRLLEQAKNKPNTGKSFN